MIFVVFDLPLTLWINCCFLYLKICCFITNFSICHSTFNLNNEGKWPFSFSKWWPSAVFIFKFSFFFWPMGFRRPKHTSNLNLIEISKMAFWVIVIFWFSKWLPSAILDFLNLKTLLAGEFLEWSVPFGELYTSEWNGCLSWWYEWTCGK